MENPYKDPMNLQLDRFEKSRNSTIVKAGS